MREEHWIVMLLTALCLGLMLCFALAARPKTRLYALAQRIFWAAVLVFFCREGGLMGLNAVTVGATAALGLPGWGAAWAFVNVFTQMK